MNSVPKNSVAKSSDLLRGCRVFSQAYRLQQKTWLEFHRRSSMILKGCCELGPVEKNLSFERNLFSSLFLTIFMSVPLKKEKLPFYAMVLQCMRALVTGCDNILDDEYKEVIPFKIHGDGKKFKSVLMVMVADRIISEIALEAYHEGLIDYSQAKEIQPAVLRVLFDSGMEEHEEETPDLEIPDAEKVIENQLYRKTGKIFEGTLGLLVEMNEVTPEQLGDLPKALGNFGVACQLLDEIKDVKQDVLAGGYNVILSLLAHGKDRVSREDLSKVLSKDKFSEQDKITRLLEKAKNECHFRADQMFHRTGSVFKSIVPGFGSDHVNELVNMIKMQILGNDLRALKFRKI